MVIGASPLPTKYILGALRAKREQQHLTGCKSTECAQQHPVKSNTALPLCLIWPLNHSSTPICLLSTLDHPSICIFGGKSRHYICLLPPFGPPTHLHVAQQRLDTHILWAPRGCRMALVSSLVSSWDPVAAGPQPSSCPLSGWNLIRLFRMLSRISSRRALCPFTQTPVNASSVLVTFILEHYITCSHTESDQVAQDTEPHRLQASALNEETHDNQHFFDTASATSSRPSLSQVDIKQLLKLLS